MDATERQIRVLEDRRYRAMLEADAETLDQLLADGLVYVHSSGTVDSKASYLEGVRAKKLTYRKIERADERVQVYGDAAVATGRARVDVEVGGALRQLSLRYTAVWARTLQGWRTVAFQATPTAA